MIRKTRIMFASLATVTLLSSNAQGQQPVTIGIPADATGPARYANPAERLSQPVRTKFTSKIGFFDSDAELGANYPRVIQLKSYPQGKGHLIATFSRRGAMPIYRSMDNGETWKFLSDIPNLSGQAALFELPQRVGEFPAGTIMAAGTGASKPGADTRDLQVSYSTDGGQTWRYLSTLAVGGVGQYDPINRAGMSIQSPVWEPFLHLDARGQLIGWVSTEQHKDEGYSQLLDYHISPDGGRTWGKPIRAVAIADGLSRPGMAVVTRNSRGKYFMSYEIVGGIGHALEPRNNAAHFKTSVDGLNWGQVEDPGTLIQDRWRQYPNATPYIEWSPYGGPEGTLMATARSIVRYNIGRVGNGMMINRKGGNGLWTLIETPIVYNPENDGYSQTMLTLAGNGREILQLITVNNRVEYAKFLLPETLPEYPFPWGGPKPVAPSR